MGTRTYSGSVTQRMLSSEDFLDSNQLAMQEFVFVSRSNLQPSLNGKSIVDCMRDARAVGLPQKFRSIYRFASKPDAYYFGRPEYVRTSLPLIDAERSFLHYVELETGLIPEIISIVISEPNLYQIAWQKLVSDYGYSGINNELVILSNLHGTPAYLKNASMFVTQAIHDDLATTGELSPIGLAMNYGECFSRAIDPTRVQPNYYIGTENKLEFTYVYMENTAYVEGVISFELPYTPATETEGADAPPEEDWLQINYSLDGEYLWFSYLMGSGDIPDLEAVERVVNSIGNYYPRIYTRVDGENIIEMPDTDERRSSTEKIVRKLGLKLETLTEQIHEGIGDVNGEFKFILLHLTISINKSFTDSLVGKYLFKYFSQVYLLCTPKEGTIREGFHQSINDKVYQQALLFSEISKDRLTGTKLDVGEYRIRYAEEVIEVEEADDDDFWYKPAKDTHIRRHIITYQEDDDNYWEIVITGLTVKEYYSGTSVTTLGDDENLSIPIDLDLLNTFNYTDKETLINRGFQVTVSTKKVVKEKWYETFVFKLVMAAISVVMNMVVPGSGMSIQSLMSAIAVTVATGIAVNLAVNLFVKLAASLGISPELVAAIVLVAAIAATAYSGGSFDFSKLSNAKSLMMAINKAVDVYQRSLAISMKAMLEEAAAFDKFDKSRTEELEKAQALLTTGVIPMDLELLITPTKSAHSGVIETSQEYCNRILALDVTSLCMDMITNYVSMATSVYPTTKPRKFSRTSVEEVLYIT